MTELLPCPFCGYAARLVHRDGMWWCECRNERDCSAVQPVCNHADVAVKTWNRRAQPATPAEQWEPVGDIVLNREDALLSITDNNLSIIVKIVKDDEMAIVGWTLPDDLRLCRRKPGG